MTTFAKCFLIVACAFGVATVVGIAMCHPHWPRGDLNSSRRTTPSELAQIESRHDGPIRFAQRAPSLRLEPLAVHADSSGPDNLEDPDEIRAWARNNPQRAREWLAVAPEGARRDVV